jgi:hypothetical protein
MILKCYHCDGLMEAQITSVPAGTRVKAKCPHCLGSGYVEDAAMNGLRSAPLVGADSQPVEIPWSERSPTRPDGSEETFRFPAEGGATERQQRAGSRIRRLIWWSVASILVIAVFALIVNLVLPGPPH